MLTTSGLLEQLEQHMNNENGEPFALYGDPAYPVKSHLLPPFREAQLSPVQQQLNPRSTFALTELYEFSESKCRVGIWQNSPIFCIYGFFQ